ncbi:amino acid permease-domain-containing protein [Globomyces pollinis-pini]|nr:amino acid permease-domain-containing protein [Globomyces pollinis-pini]
MTELSILLKTSDAPSRFPRLGNQWEFAGWGNIFHLSTSISRESTSVNLSEGCSQSLEMDLFEPVGIKSNSTLNLGSVESPLPINTNSQDFNRQSDSPKLLMNQYLGTAIAANNVVGSVFYTISVCVAEAGIFAPLSLLITSVIVYPFRYIIAEAAEAMPSNGGTYTMLLNTTSKIAAACAATLSILDYMAIAVVSASTASNYLSAAVGSLPLSLSQYHVTILLLFLFSIIHFFGIRESSKVALGIFVLHSVTMVILMICSVVKWVSIGNIQLSKNWDFQMMTTSDYQIPTHIFRGVCLGLLGVTGFESAENYVEDLQPGVFTLVMRNMWWLSTLLNAPLTLLALAIMPMDVIKSSSANVLSLMGDFALSGTNTWLGYLVSVDAVLVLCAGILSGFIGVAGLIEKMARDRVLPAFVLIKNPITKTESVITVGFLIFCVSLFMIVKGDIISLSGMFAVCFLSVMCMWAICNIFLKYHRGRLPRTVKASLGMCLLGLVGLLVGLIGNLIITPAIAIYFLSYYVVVVIIIFTIMKRIFLLRLIYWGLDQFSFRYNNLEAMHYKVSQKIISTIKNLKSQPVVFFASTDEIHLLNKAILYVRENEVTGCIKLIHFYNDQNNIPPDLIQNHHILDRAYPKIQIDLLLVKGNFTPRNVQNISDYLRVPQTLMFIACPGPDFPFLMSEFNGIRTIML